MEYADRIQGKRLIGTFLQLQRERTLLRMHLPGTEFEWLTLVIDVRSRNYTPHLLIDLPDGFAEASANLPELKIDFEYTGPDKIQCSFQTIGGSLEGREIWLNFPSIIEKRQRRAMFRLHSPAGTKLLFTANSEAYDLDVVNVSIWGALILWKSGRPVPPFMRPGALLFDLAMVFPSEKKIVKIFINKAAIKRMETGPHTERLLFGLHFLSLDKSEERHLNQLIYHFQREYLKNRLFLD